MTAERLDALLAAAAVDSAVHAAERLAGSPPKRPHVAPWRRAPRLTTEP